MHEIAGRVASAVRSDHDSRRHSVRALRRMSHHSLGCCPLSALCVIEEILGRETQPHIASWQPPFDACINIVKNDFAVCTPYIIMCRPLCWGLMTLMSTNKNIHPTLPWCAIARPPPRHAVVHTASCMFCGLAGRRRLSVSLSRRVIYM